jgi:ABC-type branched-subunit amino acid transport system substrate-binding protein
MAWVAEGARQREVLPGRALDVRVVTCPADGRWPEGIHAVIGQPCRDESGEVAGPVRIYVSVGEPFTARRPRGLKIPVAARSATAVLVDDLADRTGPGSVVALIHDRSQVGRTTAETLAAGLAAAGRPVAKRATVSGAQRTFEATTQELQAAGVTDLVLITFPVEAAAFLVELKAAMPHVQVYAPDLLASPDVTRLAGPAAEGLRVVRLQTPASVARHHPEAGALMAALDRAGITPSVPALHLAAAIDAYTAAVTAVGSTDPDLVRAALVERRTTRLGPLRFEPTGEARWPTWAVYVWTNGALTPAP